MTWIDQHPNTIINEIAPFISIQAIYQGENVHYQNTTIRPRSSLQLNITADISLIAGQTIVYGHRKSFNFTVGLYFDMNVMNVDVLLAFKSQ